jgi:hypothetical protein
MVKTVIEQLQPDTQQMPNQVLQKKSFAPKKFICFYSPESATSLTFRPSVLAINPITEKMTNPLIRQVPSLNAAKISVSLKYHFQNSISLKLKIVFYL